jgi:hypothetical protein
MDYDTRPIKSRLRWTLLLALLPPGVAATQSEYALVRDWEVHLGPASRGMTLRVAVCPSGTSYLTERSGRLVAIDRQGKVLSDGTYPQVEGVHATACGETGQLFAASRSGLIVGARSRDGAWTFTGPILLAYAPTAIAPARDGTIFVLGAGRQGQHEHVHRLTATGAPIADFAPLTTFGPSENVEGVMRDLNGASLILDETQQRILVFSARSFELHEFDFTGRKTAEHARDDPGWRQAQLHAPGARYEPGDVVTRVVQLPTGEFAARIDRIEARGENIYRSRGYLEVLDRQLRATTPTIRLSAYGLLHGADARGGLYFTNANPDGLRVARATLATR